MLSRRKGYVGAEIAALKASLSSLSDSLNRSATSISGLSQTVADLNNK